jgi:small subunit ribosomal protein S15
MLEEERKREVIEQFKLNDSDTGSAEVQVALLTERLNLLTEHLKLYPRDRYSRHALLKLVGKQKRFLAYLRKTNPESYQSVVAKLNLGR